MILQKPLVAVRQITCAIINPIRGVVTDGTNLKKVRGKSGKPIANKKSALLPLRTMRKCTLVRLVKSVRGRLRYRTRNFRAGYRLALDSPRTPTCKEHVGVGARQRSIRFAKQ